MTTLDAVTVAQLARKLDLLTAEQIQGGWLELGQRGGEAEPFLRALERKGYLTPFQSVKLAKGETEGYFIGGYRLLYKISSGSFGRVFRADDPKTGHIVAIKVLRKKWSEDKHSVDLFVREGRVGMSMHHANLVEILKVDKDDPSGQHYLVMEFVEGGNLRDFLAIRKKLEAPEALKILEDAASGLAYAYSRGVSHRDMKLTNILISSQGQAKVVDFGLAGGSYQPPDKNDPLRVDRTVDYAGLEEATGVTAGDIRSDIFFLGCVFYELLTGRSPLDMSRDARSRMRKDRFTKVIPISKDEVQGPPVFFKLLETMMSLDPQQRYQTPGQLLEAIKEVRREMSGNSVGSSTPAARSLFIVEKDERLRDAMRDKFKELGFKVFLASDASRALDRFQQQPFDALIVDGGTTGEEGITGFEKVMWTAWRQSRPCAGVLVLSEHQKDRMDKVDVSHSPCGVLLRPVTLKQLYRKIQELLGDPVT